MWMIMRKLLLKVIYAILLGYYSLKGPSLSIKDKTIIYGAMGYFIIPFDFIHDWIPFAGVSDDFIALAWAVVRLVKNITPEVRAQAKARLGKWFKLRPEDEKWLKRK